MFGSTLARAEDLAWIVRAPAAGVKEGGIARIELVSVNAHQTSQPVDAPELLSGDLGEAGDKVKVELRRVGEPPKFTPPGGFGLVQYDMVIPPGAKVGESVLRLRSPIEASAVLKILPGASEIPTTKISATTTIAVVAPEPLAPEPATRVPTTSQSGLVEYVKNKLSPHERMYFIDGNMSPSAKFQISFKYQIFNQQSDLAAEHPWVNGFYGAYTQTSFWDISKDSAPFFDSTYRPEIFWSVQDLRMPNFPGLARFDFQTGLQHESNGKSGDDSRTVNSFYVQPIFTLGDKDALFLTVAPKAYVYLGSLADNPDITDYRGYFDLKFIFGQADGLQAAITGRIGDDWDKGSVQLDLSYPLRKIIFDSLDIYLHAQLFNGYGESLLRYDEQQGTTFRVGLSLVR